MANTQEIVDLWMNLQNGVLAALNDLVSGFIVFLPKLLLAIIVFVIGAWIAALVELVVIKILEAIKFDKIFDKKGWTEAFKKADIDIEPSKFIGEIVKWVFLITFIVIIANALGWTGLNEVLTRFVTYLPNILVAVLIFVVTVIVSDIVEKVVVASVSKMNIGYAKAIGAITAGAIWLFAIAAILTQLSIAAELVQIFFSKFLEALVYFFAIAGGIAFGWGGKEIAGDFLKGIHDKMKR